MVDEKYQGWRNGMVAVKGGSTTSASDSPMNAGDMLAQPIDQLGIEPIDDVE